ncbi:MAG TPA: hypothetical protein VGA92_06750 [Candidatus Nitrosotenuis sp.]|jgi:hypothetical protein
MSKVVSAKVPDELKKKADKYGIKVGALLRESLEAKINAIERQLLSSKLDDLSSKVGSKIKKQDIIKAVRSSRDER